MTLPLLLSLLLLLLPLIGHGNVESRLVLRWVWRELFAIQEITANRCQSGVLTTTTRLPLPVCNYLLASTKDYCQRLETFLLCCQIGTNPMFRGLLGVVLCLLQHAVNSSPCWTVIWPFCGPRPRARCSRRARWHHAVS